MLSQSSANQNARWFKLAVSGLLAFQGAIATIAITEFVATTPGTNLLRVATAQDEGRTAESIYRQAAPAVVYIETDQGTGSGVIIESSGLIATNAHVLEGARRIRVELRDGRKFEAKPVSMGRENCLDLALLQIKATNLPKLKFAPPGSVQPGQQVFAIGYPRGIKPSSITQGIVSNVHQQYGLVQTDTTLIPGNSGGALLNSRGELVAINTKKGMGADTGMNLAVSADKVKSLIQAYMQGVSPTIGRYVIPGTPPVGQPVAQSLSISGNIVSGKLQAGSGLVCADESQANLYTFQGQAYDPVMLEMSSPEVGSTMLLLGPDGEVIAEGSVNNPNQVARIIEELPVTGTYTLIANSTKAIASAQYRLQATTPLLVKRDRLDRSTEACMEDGSPCRSYVFSGRANQDVVIALHQFEFDPFLVVMDMKGNVIVQGKASRQGTVKVSLPQNGSYKLVVSTVNPKDRGQFIVSVHAMPKSPQSSQVSRNQ
jgi:serine protease Do